MSGPLAHLATLFGPLEPTVRPLLPGVYLVLGVASLLWGASVWRSVRVASGVLLGIWVGMEVGGLTHDARVGLVAATVLAIGAGVVFYLVERVAVAALGGAVAVLVIQVAWPLVHPGQVATTTIQGVSALVGTLLGAFLHQPVIKAVTAIFGAFLITQAVGYGEKLPIVLGLAACGWAWQMWGRMPVGGGSGGARPAKKKGRER